MRKFGIVVLSIILFTSAANAQKFTLDKIVAVVGAGVILQSDVELLNAQYTMQGVHPDKCLLAQGLITQKLLVQQAAIDSIEVRDDVVDEEVNRRMRNMEQRAGGQEKLETFLGRSEYQYKDEIKPDVKELLVAEKMRQKITEKLNTTPQDVKDYFNKIPKDSLPTFNKEVEVAEIVFEPKLTKDEKEVYRQKSQDLLDRIQIKGEDFATLATAYSQDPGSAPQGGDVGFADRNTFVKEFTAWAFKLKAKEFSPVFESPDYGFFFLQVIERRGEQVHVRHILITPAITPESLERAKGKADTIYNLLIKNKKADFSAAASFYSDNKETKYTGGMILNPENVEVRSTYIPNDKLDPQIALVVDTMKVGGISKPVLFTDERGRKSYRIFYLKSVTDAHKANLAQDLPKLKILATEDKTSRTISQWFAKKRKETFIKIDPQYQACAVLKDWATPVASAQTKP